MRLETGMIFLQSLVPRIEGKIDESKGDVPSYCSTKELVFMVA
ncbi:hypothetical protein RchiOBHm_Chr5g0047161 [Rosa chinensis]|uniref:Uncharacterized protein n=1 Tax=Rosa chinensis TaxID=74649 RepID=A0A2P6QEB5_ROSCH|nr:hypothetical protein RchiOBHm_Chr5g0047161 [Rosa chinensis]